MKRRSARAKIIAVLLKNINGHSPLSHSPLKVVEVYVQLANKQRQFPGRSYDVRVVRVEG
jgi:hypothetical protein